MQMYVTLFNFDYFYAASHMIGSKFTKIIKSILHCTKIDNMHSSE